MSAPPPPPPGFRPPVITHCDLFGEHFLTWSVKRDTDEVMYAMEPTARAYGPNLDTFFMAAAIEMFFWRDDAKKVSPETLSFLRQNGKYSRVLVPVPDGLSLSHDECVQLVQDAEQHLDKNYSESGIPRLAMKHENVPHTPTERSAWYSGKSFLSLLVSPAEISQGFVDRLKQNVAEVNTVDH